MSKIHLKTPDEIHKMRIAGRLAAEVLEMIEPYVKPGITTLELNDICHRYIVHEQKAIPACKGYRPSKEFPPFPKSICTSLNYVVCHGIPSNRKLKSGDILNIDVTVIKDGYHGDTSKMFLVGECTEESKKLVQCTQESLYLGIQLVKPGAKLGDIGDIIQKHAEEQGYSVVREYCGHGIGREFHEAVFQVPHYGKPGTGLELRPGMTFTIEPMINAGKRGVTLMPDGWTVETADHSLSAQWEHTLLVTETGVEILTLRPEEQIRNLDSSAKGI